MSSDQYEVILDRLTNSCAKFEEVLNKSHDLGSKFFAHYKSCCSKSDEEVQRLEHYLEEVRQDREATLKRCDMLLAQNNGLVEELKRKDRELKKKDEVIEKTRERYDRLMDILETSMIQHRPQHSSASVSFEGLEVRDTKNK